MSSADREAELRLAIEELYFGYRAFTALPDEILAERGLGRTHHRILYFVHRTPGLSAGELLSVLAVTKQAVHKPIKELEQRGLLRIKTDVSDRRVRRLTVTEAGAELESRLTRSQMELLEEAFGGLAPAAQAHWHEVMRRLGAS
ncbi:MarR family winged helix-turn-helix transcriptional regulator [Humibacter albus]|uniref:MarR family winged helix-turn-helix transcriptional regulator n=1 Tax=Humibacter albus TaxID=427754 RepID=UPI00040D50D4|nr:MarR family transcriptional regulator [Humibacter albus]